MHFSQIQYLWQASSVPAVCVAFFIAAIIIFIYAYVRNQRLRATVFRYSPADMAFVMLSLNKDTITQVGYQQTKEGLPKQDTKSYYKPTSHLISFAEDIYHENSPYAAAEAVRLADCAKHKWLYPYLSERLIYGCALTGSTFFTLALIIDAILSKPGINHPILAMYWIGMIVFLIAVFGGIVFMILQSVRSAKATRILTEAENPPITISDEDRQNLDLAERTYSWYVYGNLFPYGLGILYLLTKLFVYLAKTRRI